MSWTDERVTLLKKLWGEGKTAAEIAKQLGGVTRNAVIGKAHRLKLSNRLSPIQQNKKPKIQVTSNQNVKKSIPERKVEKPKSTIPEVKGGVSLLDLKAGQCRWPQGDPREGEFGFCGAAGIPGLPYCAEHAKVAYQAATRNKVLKAEDFEDKKTSASEKEEAELQAIKKAAAQ